MGKKRALKETDPALAGSGGGSGGLSGLTIAQLLTDIGGPAAYGLATMGARKDAKERSEVNLTVPDLMSGTVRDMPRPSFALPARSATGSSLAEENAANLFRDAFRTQQEAGFNVQNEASKIAQENQILERTNRNALVTSQIKNQEEMANSGMAFREYMARYGDQISTVESLFGNVSQDLGQLSYLTEAQKISKAAEIVRNPDVYGEDSEEYKRALAIMTSGMAGKQRRRRTKFST
jgi:hypothetical protein